MATKKTESGSVVRIENQEDWDKLMKFNGLVVADMYQDWTGPCKPVVSLFNKLNVQINNEAIKFVQVKVDNIRSVQLYRGKAEPTFLMLGGGQLVGVVRGVNAPILKDLCIQKFEEELKVMKGEIERVVIRDPGIKRLESMDNALAEDTYEFYYIEMTFAIIKPDVISNGQLDDVIQQLKEEGFDIIRKEIRQLSKDEIKMMYSSLEKEDYIEEILTYMTTGKSCVVAMSCDIHDPVSYLIEFTGPSDVEKAKNTMPESLRAIYGLSGYRNGIHSAESREEAIRSISLVFPDLVLKKKENNEDLERTVIVIPQNIYAEQMKSIIEQIADAQLKTIDITETPIPKVDIVYLFKDIIVQKEVPMERIEEMYGSKFIVICFQNKDCIKIAKYFLYLYEATIEETYDIKKLTLTEVDTDLIYASDDRLMAIRDIQHFFRIEVTFAIIKPDAHEQRDEIIKLIKASGFNIPIAEEIILSAKIAEDIYRNVKNMPFYQQHIQNMISGPCYVMVLSKHNAVTDWRDLMGCVNPEEAAEQSPDKLRGIFGSTILENALHGSSSKADCTRCIRLVFGNLQFDERGNVCGQTSLESGECFPIKVYVPGNIDESRVSDILNKLSNDRGITYETCEKVLSLTIIAKLYSTIKAYDSHPNVKCFITVGGNIIPVIQHEENVAWEKLDKINAAPRTQKNFDLRRNLWIQRIADKKFEPETRYIIYKFTKQIQMASKITDDYIETHPKVTAKFSIEDNEAIPVDNPDEIPFENQEEASGQGQKDTGAENSVKNEVEDAVEIPASIPIAKSKENISEAQIEIPIETPIEIPIEIPIESPAETPIEIPIETPIETSIEIPIENPVVNNE